MPPLTDAYSGARLTHQTQLLDAINSQRRFPIDDKLYDLVSGEADFLNLIRKISKVTMTGPDKSFIENRAPWLNLQRGFWYNDSSTNFSATNLGQSVDITVTKTSSSTAGGYPSLRPGDIIQVVDEDDPTKTANILLVSVSTQKWTGILLTQAPGFTPSAADAVYLVGSAFGENAAFTTGSYGKPQTRWFSSQIFKDMVSYSRTLKKSKDIIYGNEVERILREALAEHQVKIDRALLFGTGRRSSTGNNATTNPFGPPADNITDADGNVVRTSASFLQVMQATTNRDVSLETRMFPITMSSATYETILETFEKIFRYGSDVKETICGRGVVSYFNIFAKANADYQMTAGENEFGIKVTKLITPHGVLNLRPSKGMKDGGYNYAMAIIDPDNISIGEFDALTWGGLPKTRDGEDIEILSDLGLWVRKPETHAWMWFS